MVRFEDISGLSGMRRSLPDLPASFWKGDARAIEQAWARPETHETLAEAMALLGRMIGCVAMLLDPNDIFVHGPLFQGITPLWEHVVAAYDAAIADLHGSYCQPLRACQSDFEAAVGVALYGLECTYPRGA